MNPNPSPRERFQAVPDRISALVNILSDPFFQYAIDHAMYQLLENIRVTQESGNMNQAAMNAAKLVGASEFVAALRSLIVLPSPGSRPMNTNLETRKE